MKKKGILFGIIILCLFCFNSSSLYSQTSDYNSKIKLNAGISMAGYWVNISDMNNSIVNNSISSPVGQLSYEYQLESWVSLGVMGSYQYFKADLLDINSTGNLILLQAHRANFAVKPTFYYVNQQSVSLYSGLRLGLTWWQLRIETGNLIDYIETITPDFLDNFVLSRIPVATKYVIPYTSFAAQLTIFGFEAYFTDNFGFNLEFSIGSPYFLSAGLNYRF